MAKKYLGGGQWTEVIDKDSSNRDRSQVSKETPMESSAKTNVGDNAVSESAEKEFREIEKNSLVGDVSMREAKPTIRAKQTIRLEGFGKIISGLFLVEKVTNRFSASDGYTQTIGVRRTGFGDSVKKAMVVIPPQPKPPEPPRKPPVAPPVTKKTYTVVKGDNLSKIASKYGTTWQKLYEANKSVIGSNPNLIYPGQVLTIP